MSRILLKLSGEALANKEKHLAIDPMMVETVAKQVKVLLDQDYEIAIVIGGGNFWRGASAEKNGIPRVRADYIGMLATMMNGLAIQSGFEQIGIKVKIQSSVTVDRKVADNYVNSDAMDSLEDHSLVIFTGGTGRPYFTTDTAATLFASEIGAKKILMGKNGVDGVYDKDPNKHDDAKKYETLSYNTIIKNDLTVMDTTAASMAKDNKIEIIVFDIKAEDCILKAVKGDIPHTKLTWEDGE